MLSALLFSHHFFPQSFEIKLPTYCTLGVLSVSQDALLLSHSREYQSY